MSKRTLVALAIVIAATAVGFLAAEALAQQTTEVDAKDDNTFAPPTITVKVGDTITFRNVGKGLHTATASDKSFDTGNMTGGQSKAIKLTKAGKIPYVCIYHEALGMKGEITVEAAAGAQPAAASPSPSASPSPAAAATTAANQDVDAQVPKGIKLFPLLGGGLAGLMLFGVAVSWIRNVVKTAGNR
jgi:plastocyanin